MPDQQNTTRFNLDLPGFELSITGDRAFVEELYHQVSQDLLPVLMAANRRQSKASPGPTPSAAPAEKPSDKKAPAPYVWVYGCTPYYNKVYVAEAAQLKRGPLGKHVDPHRLRRIFVERDQHELFTSLAGGQKTLWAEFTEHGRELFQAAASGAATGPDEPTNPRR